MSSLVVRVEPYFVTTITVNPMTKAYEMSSSEVLQSTRPQELGLKDIDSNNVLELVVFLMDQTEICLSIRGKTRELNAKQVLDDVYTRLMSLKMRFGSEYKELFSIWITSPYLELQLQPSHRPFSLLAKWDKFLRRHGPPELTENPIFIEKDEPTLSFQRNVFCNQSIEEEITDADIGALKLLYFEAKLNVLDGRYPTEDFEQLAAYQMAIDLGVYEKTEYSVEYIRQHLKELIPFNYIKPSDGKNGFNGLIRTLSRSSPSLRCSQNILQKYKELSKEKLSEYKLLRSYLEICWSIPCYGSAYFSAQIERPIKSKIDSIVNHFDLEVWVAVNQTGLHLISKEKPELLLSINYMDLCWAVGCPESSDPNCIPCIYVTIPDQKDSILQIFSRQHRLIESLLNSFIKDTKTSLGSIDSNRNSSNSFDVVDGVAPIPPPRIVQRLYSEPTPQITSKTYKPERLSLAKFDSSGQVLNKTGTLVRALKQNN